MINKLIDTIGVCATIGVVVTVICAIVFSPLLLTEGFSSRHAGNVFGTGIGAWLGNVIGRAICDRRK